MQTCKLEMCMWILLSLAIETELLSHDQGNCSSQTDILLKAAKTQDCNGKQSCYNLSRYLSSPQCYFTSNTTIHFLPGIHLLEENITVSGVSNLTLVGSSTNSSQGPTATIRCSGAQIGLVFQNITILSIMKLSFINCGRIISKYLPEKPMQWFEMDFQAAVFVTDVHTLMVEGVHIEGSSGYGLLGWNVLGDSQVLNSMFNCNNNINECHFQRWNRKRKTITDTGGNALIVLSKSCHSVNLRITDSHFSRGRNGHNHLGGGGLAIHLRASCSNAHNVSVVISSCTFHSNVAHVGANAFIDITSLMICDTCSYAVHISNCTFSSGHASVGGGGLYLKYQYSGSELSCSTHSRYFSPWGKNELWWLYDDYPWFSSSRSLLRLLMRSTKIQSMEIDIQIWLSHFSNNSGAGEGGGIRAFFSYRCASLLWVLKNCTLHRNEAKVGAGIYASVPKLDEEMKIDITGIQFRHNVASLSGGGMFLDVKGIQELTNETSVLMSDCYFMGNKAYTGAAVRITADSDSYFHHEIGCFRQSGKRSSIVLANVVFDSNRAPSNAQMCTGALHLLNVKITIVNSQFGNNHCSSIYTFSSKVHLKGELEFVSNKALTGGGIHLDCSSDSPLSLVCFDGKTKIYMTNNTALENGGAIAARENCRGNSRSLYTWFSWKGGLPKVILENNTAQAKGDSIYVQSLALNKTGVLPSNFWRVFTIHGENRPLEIAAPSYKACLCLGSNAGLIPEWMEEDECPQKGSVFVYMGQSFNVTVAGVGRYNYPIPSVLRTTIKSESGSARLGIGQSTQELSYRCTNVTYSITSLEDEVRLYLSIGSTLMSESDLMSLIPPAVINITLLPCPLGFELFGKPPICSCASPLRYIAGISCDIDTTLIYHPPPTMWIGILSRDNTIAVHRNCPFDYCKPGKTHINLSNPDEQCNSNHAGILCGGCQPGLSLALGTSQCLQCSNIYLLLLIPFALAGVALVLLLLKCNLTVSVGTINGLIFYANIIRVSHTIFFPKGNVSILTKLLSVFIAWINLDLGIETCFFKGMNVYAKAWLQFVFPVYIWILVGAIIFSSRYSLRIAKLMGSNAVPVLATLFLLSYAKLLRSVITVVSPITLTDQNGRVSLLWLQDGNVAFLQGVHIILFAMAMVTTFLYVVPFTLLTVLAPYLQAWSNLRVLCWVVKLKPLLDAYQGPYKDRFRYWTGMMLVIRIALFIAFASNTLGDPRVNLLAITVALFAIIVGSWNSGRVYKSYLMHVIESFYLLNLGIFTAATQFLQTSQASPQKQEYLTCIMVGSAFAAFCTVLLYHCYQAVKNKWILQYVHSHCPKRRVQFQDRPGNEVAPVVPQPTVSVVELKDLREPLLTEN